MNVCKIDGLNERDSIVMTPEVRASGRKAWFWVTALSLASVLILAGCGKSEAQTAGGPPPAPVTVLKVAAADVPLVYEYVGQSVGSREVEVRARVAGILQKRHFTEGAPVRAGQSLYQIDPVPLQTALARADADVAAAEARQAQAARTLARLKPLWEAKATSQKEFDDATSAEQIAAADLLGARARRAEAALNLGYARVEAPIAGVAGRSLVSEGTLVNGSQTLLTTLVQTHPIKLRFGVPDTDQQRWRADAAAGSLKLPAGEAFDVEVKLADGSLYANKGKLTFADTRISGSTGTIEAEAVVPNPQGQLKPGQFVRVRLTGAVRLAAIKLPTRAVLEGPQGKFVYLAVDGKAQPRPVQVGDQLADGWIIKSGLQAGDPVIVDGMARIFFPGAPVQLAPAAGALTAAPAAAPGPAASTAAKK